MSSELKCNSCTFINAAGTSICYACGRTLNAPSIDLTQLGIRCNNCTFDNSMSSNKCAMCEAILTRPPELKYLVGTQTCQICFCDMTEIFKMPRCFHFFCTSCAKQHFTIKITQCSINSFRCPMDICEAFDQINDKIEFFTELKSSLQGMLAENVFEIYDSKVQILSVINLPGFLRCSLCNHGFINYSTSKSVACPACKRVFCSVCTKKWTRDHSTENCAPNDRDSDKENLLTFTNASCPKCKYRYFLERGGCMHICCPQCSYEYCEFCYEKMTGKGKSCDFPNCTKGKSLHSHHPRSCMYYIKEMDHEKLEELLMRNNFSYVVSQSQSFTDLTCNIKVSVDMGGNWSNSVCNEPAQAIYNNMCEKHYKWHLGALMRKYKIDPLDAMNNLECVCELNRNNIKVANDQPNFHLPIVDESTAMLRNLIRQKIPYK